LHALGRAEGCTLFMVLLAAFDVVLSRFAGQEDIVVGTPIAGRGRTELEGLIGFFINTLVMRTDLSGNPQFREVLARVRRTALDAYAHQDLPFEKLVDEMNPDRNTSFTPIFQVMFNLHNEPGQSLELGGLKVTPFGIDRGTAKFDLSVALTESEHGLFANYEYNADLFDAETIDAMATCFAAVLAQVARAPEAHLSDLGAPGESAVPAASGWAGSLITRFADQVAQDPRRLAVQTTDISWSYGALNARANGVAHALASARAPRIGLMGVHDAPLLVGLLGILKSGAAYVPLDPALPDALLQQRIAAADIGALVADTCNIDRARGLAGNGLTVINIDIDGSGQGTAAPDPVAVIGSDTPAYILYTSGTTGAPKGVLQTHGGVMQNIAAYTHGLQLCADDRLSWLSGYGYDAAVQDIFGALLNGAAVCPLAAREAGGSDLVAALVTAKVTVLHATPTLYRHLFGAELNCTHDLSRIRRVVLGGEQARRADFELFKARFTRGTVFVNGYGLTESTLGLQFAADHDARLPGQLVPVGRAAAGVEVELLDAGGKPSWIGEITLTGAGVAQGYWRQAELIRQPFSTIGAVRRFRTGDIGRRLPDGQIAWVGRMDEQVKVRGYRVEPGEIEAVLAELAEVTECVVVADNEVPGETRLVAYVVTGDVSMADLRTHLSDRLPVYMLPQAFEVLDVLPRLPNGKVDRGQLPQPGWGRDVAQALVPARTELEGVLTAIWQDVLGLDTVGVHDDFFALGGHSLLATRLVSRIRDRLELEVPLFSVFEYPTVAGLAEAMEHEARSSSDVLPSLGRRGRDPSLEQAV